MLLQGSTITKMTKVHDLKDLFLNPGVIEQAFAHLADKGCLSKGQEKKVTIIIGYCTIAVIGANTINTFPNLGC